jgi:hypothetical protein
MEEVGSSETLFNIYHTTRGHIPGDTTLPYLYEFLYALVGQDSLELNMTASLPGKLDRYKE